MGFFDTVRQHFGFAQEDLGDDPTSDEIATRRIQQLAELMKWLPNPDLILKKTGKRIRHLRELLYDDEVFSCVQYLHSALRESKWKLGEHENTAAVERTSNWLGALDFERIDNEIIEARLFGYQPFEIDWREEGNLWRPADLVGKPPEWFAYTPKNELALRTTRGRSGFNKDLQDLPPGKFITARNRPSYNNPYGTAVLSRCWWPVVFKKGDLKYWITFAEKYGMPHALGKHPRGASPQEIDNLLTMLENMVRDAVAAIPDDSSVELMESPFRASSTGLYKAIIDWTERTVNKVILSNEMTTSAGEYGTQALGGEQIKKVSAKVISDCKRMKAALITKLVRLTWHYNFGPGDDAPAYEEQIDEEAGKERSERDLNLTRAGVQFTDQYWQREYGFEEGDFELADPERGLSSLGPVGSQAQIQPQPSNDNFSALARGKHFTNMETPAEEPAGQQLIDTLAERATTPETDQAEMERLLAEPIRLIREGEDANAVLEALARAYPAMDAEKLEERLASLFFISETWGRLEADTEVEEEGDA